MATINDLVLVHVDHKPGFYARIEEIAPDVKPGWWQVKLLVLTFPLQIYTWILDESQVAGADFTMGGTPIRLEKVESLHARPEEPAPTVPPVGKKNAAAKPGAKVVSLLDRKKEG
ncbi:hypothetical protein [Geobacter argillaceus]|uniref:Uncharacterized protein n=1 Tax=Geobacter argillaceus TaxID=345631 RepID=A0A562WRW7_9BACT|nr:hypothetical protein [Geobacter argillaceus]TWJ33148.1 hypothetical protein JN12_00561 [Geobacter argillaceus]